MLKLAYLPTTSLQHLWKGQLIACSQSQHSVDILKQEIQKSHSYSPPLHHNIVTNFKHWHNFHSTPTFALSLYSKSFHTTSTVVLLQGEESSINKEAAIAI